MYDERKMKHDKGFVWTSPDDWLHSLVILTEEEKEEILIETHTHKQNCFVLSSKKKKMFSFQRLQLLLIIIHILNFIMCSIIITWHIRRPQSQIVTQQLHN